MCESGAGRVTRREKDDEGKSQCGHSDLAHRLFIRTLFLKKGEESKVLK